MNTRSKIIAALCLVLAISYFVGPMLQSEVKNWLEPPTQKEMAEGDNSLKTQIITPAPAPEPAPLPVQDRTNETRSDRLEKLVAQVQEKRDKQAKLDQAMVDDQLDELQHKQALREIDRKREEWLFELAVVEARSEKQKEALREKRILEEARSGSLSSKQESESFGTAVVLNDGAKSVATPETSGASEVNATGEKNTPATNNEPVPVRLLGILSATEAMLNIDDTQSVMVVGASYGKVKLKAIGENKVKIVNNGQTQWVNMSKIRFIGQAGHQDEHTHDELNGHTHDELNGHTHE